MPVGYRQVILQQSVTVEVPERGHKMLRIVSSRSLAGGARPPQSRSLHSGQDTWAKRYLSEFLSWMAGRRSRAIARESQARGSGKIASGLEPSLEKSADDVEATAAFIRAEIAEMEERIRKMAQF